MTTKGLVSLLRRRSKEAFNTFSALVEMMMVLVYIPQLQLSMLKRLSTALPLLHRTHAPLYIYLRDHNNLINPPASLLKVSYRDPRSLVDGAPQQPPFEYKLSKPVQDLLDRQIFEEYKNKILRGTIDEEQEKQPDQLWGEEEPPAHYFSRISKIDLMRVSQPQNSDAEEMLQMRFDPFFRIQGDVEVTAERIRDSSVQQLVGLSVAARRQGLEEREIWFQVEEGLGRGKKLYLLNSEELVKLKWAFDGKTKQGTPIFHEILSSLLQEDIPTMGKDLLLHLFFACRYSNPGQTNLQAQTIEALRPSFPSLTFTEKTSFLLALSLCSKPLKHSTKVHKRRRYQFKQLAAELILQLNFWQLQLTHQNVDALVFALAKLQVDNTRFITYPLRDHIEGCLEEYCQDAQRLFRAVVYLGELEAGEGVMTQQLGQRLREKAEVVWEEYSDIERMRMIHAFWNIGLMDQSLLELYKGVELHEDSSLLHYACQVELGHSSEREWQITQCLVNLPTVPLPYFRSYKRFYNYIKSTTEWNLGPLADKLRNTEYYFDVMRGYDSAFRVPHFRKLKLFEKFIGVSFMQHSAPVQNLELAHFGYPHHQVCLDVVNQREMIPGTSQLKESFMNKVRSLSYLGWRHLAFSEKELKELSWSQAIDAVQTASQPYEEGQREVIEYEEYQQSVEIELRKHLDEMKYWQLDDINEYMAEARGEKYIQLGEEIINEDQKGRYEKDLSQYEP